METLIRPSIGWAHTDVSDDFRAHWLISVLLNHPPMKSGTVGAILLVVVIAIAAVVLVTNPDDGMSDRPFPLPVTEADKTYLPADEAEAEYDAAIDRMVDDLKASQDVDAMVSAILDGDSALAKIYDQYVWVYLDYNTHPAQYAEEYTKWAVVDSTASDTLRSGLREVLIVDESGMMEEALRTVGIDPDDLRSYKPLTPEEEDLLSAEARLVTEYNDLMSKDYSAVYSGVTVTLSNYGSVGDFTAQQRMEMYYGLLYDKWYDAASVYSELVDVRNEYATLQGFDNYAEYSYESIYGRDYRPSDAWTFTECMGEAYSKYSEIWAMTSQDPKLSGSNLDWMTRISKDEMLDIARVHECNVGGDLPDLMDYMREYELIYLRDNPDSLGGAYTTAINLQRSATIFVGSSYVGESLVTCVVHEFGHASNLCLNSRGSSCYDAMEIHSQGNEALFYASADRCLREGSDAMAASGVQQLLYTVWTAGLWTQFELWAYQTQAEIGESLTVQMLSDGFNGILERNGMDEAFYYPPEVRGLVWVQIPHLFEVPTYYVSYATSALNALEIFAMAVEDFDEARDIYLDFLYLEDANGYVDAVSRVGLTNMLNEGAASSVVDSAFEALNNLVAHA